jgi:hypothetical protein
MFIPPKFTRLWRGKIGRHEGRPYGRLHALSLVITKYTIIIR